LSNNEPSNLGAMSRLASLTLQKPAHFAKLPAIVPKAIGC
jgi:hypothetical protein